MIHPHFMRSHTTAMRSCRRIVRIRPAMPGATTPQGNGMKTQKTPPLLRCRAGSARPSISIQEEIGHESGSTSPAVVYSLCSRYCSLFSCHITVSLPFGVELSVLVTKATPPRKKNADHVSRDPKNA